MVSSTGHPPALLGVPGVGSDESFQQSEVEPSATTTELSDREKADGAVPAAHPSASAEEPAEVYSTGAAVADDEVHLDAAAARSSPVSPPHYSSFKTSVALEREETSGKEGSVLLPDVSSSGDAGGTSAGDGSAASTLGEGEASTGFVVDQAGSGVGESGDAAPEAEAVVAAEAAAAEAAVRDVPDDVLEAAQECAVYEDVSGVIAAVYSARYLVSTVRVFWVVLMGKAVEWNGVFTMLSLFFVCVFCGIIYCSNFDTYVLLHLAFHPPIILPLFPTALCVFLVDRFLFGAALFATILFGSDVLSSNNLAASPCFPHAPPPRRRLHVQI